MALPFSNSDNLALNGWLAFGSQAEGKHSGISVVRIPVSAAQAAAAAGTERDTGFDLKAGWLVLDAWLNVTATHAAKTVNVGTDSNQAGDADGLIVGASLATAGFVYPDATVTAGATETYYSANTRGALLADYIVGTNAASDFGLFHKKPYLVDTDRDLTITTTASTSTAAFDIFLLILDPTPTAAIDVYNTNAHANAA